MPDPREQVRRTVLFSGTVQGVGFRYTIERLARSFAVTGYARNLPDGRVELVAEGPPAELGRFEAAVADAMAGYIRDAQRAETPATGEFDRFTIRF